MELMLQWDMTWPPLSRIGLKWIKAKLYQQICLAALKTGSLGWANISHGAHWQTLPDQGMRNVLHLQKLTFGICGVFSITHSRLSKGQSSNCAWLASASAAPLSVWICMRNGIPASCVPLDKWPHLSGPGFLLKNEEFGISQCWGFPSALLED